MAQGEQCHVLLPRGVSADPQTHITDLPFRAAYNSSLRSFLVLVSKIPVKEVQFTL